MRMALRLMDPFGRMVPCPESTVGADGIFPLLIEQSYALSQEGRVQVLELPRGVAGEATAHGPGPLGRQ
ncbi:hypothetical protein CSW26_02105, partial [Thermus scotoductus]|uniref:hypothetical protein n=1 Tax=Thermus scotoductus TaxID=37636 RepID=UPI0010023BC0